MIQMDSPSTKHFFAALYIIISILNLDFYFFLVLYLPRAKHLLLVKAKVNLLCVPWWKHMLNIVGEKNSYPRHIG